MLASLASSCYAFAPAARLPSRPHRQNLRGDAPVCLAKKDKGPESPYKSSVSLPLTDFSQRANAVTREPELQKFWDEEEIYEAVQRTYDPKLGREEQLALSSRRLRKLFCDHSKGPCERYQACAACA